MPEFNPFDMDFDGDVDGIDFLAFDYLIRHVLGRDRVEDQVKDDDGPWEDETLDDLSDSINPS